MKLVVIKLIDFYQQWFSPDHSFWAKHRFPYGYCRYYPSCSAYAKGCIERFGIGRGAAKALKRILRCNPFKTGGYDPLTHG